MKRKKERIKEVILAGENKNQLKKKERKTDRKKVGKRQRKTFSNERLKWEWKKKERKGKNERKTIYSNEKHDERKNEGKIRMNEKEK